MAYIYRYINLEKREVCYIGKVTKDKTDTVDPLSNRHRQHKGENWYKEIGDENILLQYIECSHTDADILETWLINFYGATGQLVNIAKMNWGKSSIDLYPVFGGRWRNFGQNRYKNREAVYNMLVPIADTLLGCSEDLEYHLDFELEIFCHKVKSVAKDLEKTYRLSSYDMQDDFLRIATKQNDDTKTSG